MVELNCLNLYSYTKIIGLREESWNSLNGKILLLLLLLAALFRDSPQWIICSPSTHPNPSVCMPSSLHP